MSLNPCQFQVRVGNRNMSIRHFAQRNPSITLKLFLQRFFEVFPSLLPQFLKMQDDSSHEKEFVAQTIFAMQNHKHQHPDFNFHATLTTLSLFTQDPETAVRLQQLNQISMEAYKEAPKLLTLYVAALNES